MKNCRNNLNKWSEKVHVAFFTDCITTNHSTDFSSYYLLHRVHSVLSFDLTETTFLVQEFQANIKLDTLLILYIQ